MLLDVLSYIRWGLYIALTGILIIFTSCTPPWVSSQAETITANQRRSAPITAALIQYYRDYGTYPVSLDDLKPEYLTDTGTFSTAYGEGFEYYRNTDGVSGVLVFYVDKVECSWIFNSGQPTTWDCIDKTGIDM